MFSLGDPCMLLLAVASLTFSLLMPSLSWPHSCARTRGLCPPLYLSASAGTLPLLLPGQWWCLPTRPL